jgi:hypothetical protein
VAAAVAAAVVMAVIVMTVAAAAVAVAAVAAMAVMGAGHETGRWRDRCWTPRGRYCW